MWKGLRATQAHDKDYFRFFSSTQVEAGMKEFVII